MNYTDNLILAVFCQFEYHETLFLPRKDIQTLKGIFMRPTKCAIWKNCMKIYLKKENINETLDKIWNKNILKKIIPDNNTCTRKKIFMPHLLES